MMAAPQAVVNAEAALAAGDLIAARRWADEAVTAATGWYWVWAKTARARVALAENQLEQAEYEALEGLARGAEIRA
jgi:hypothetical protein